MTKEVIWSTTRDIHIWTSRSPRRRPCEESILRDITHPNFQIAIEHIFKNGAWPHSISKNIICHTYLCTVLYRSIRSRSVPTKFGVRNIACWKTKRNSYRYIYLSIHIQHIETRQTFAIFSWHIQMHLLNFFYVFWSLPQTMLLKTLAILWPHCPTIN